MSQIISGAPRWCGGWNGSHAVTARLPAVPLRDESDEYYERKHGGRQHPIRPRWSPMDPFVSPDQLREQMDRIYAERPLAEIPWNHETPPDVLVDLVESGRLSPCRAADLGCGAGNYAVWLATRGFEVTGFDISEAALVHARRLAAQSGASCAFVALDLVSETGAFAGAFDFAYDWEVLHHIFPGDRERYVEHVHRMLRRGASYLSVCFSEQDGSFGGAGKCRSTPIGTTLYFSSEDELRTLFGRWFLVDELRTIPVVGRGQPHLMVKALLRKGDGSSRAGAAIPLGR